MPKEYPSLSQLSEIQRCHLAWRLDHKTVCGMLTACRVARMENGDLNIVDVFEQYGAISRAAAKIHATKVMNFKIGINANKNTA